VPVRPYGKPVYCDSGAQSHARLSYLFACPLPVDASGYTSLAACLMVVDAQFADDAALRCSAMPAGRSVTFGN